MFFVYADCKPDGTPFYIGKGNGSRLHSKGRKNKGHSSICSENPGWYRGLIFMGSESESLQKEKEYIAKYRPILVNKTAGGQGTTGLRHSEEAKLAVSLANKGRKWSAEARQRMSEQRKGIPSPLRGVPLADKHKQNIIKGLIGRNQSEETKLKIKLAQVGIPKPHMVYMCIECGYISSAQHVKRHQSEKNHVGREKL